MANVGATVISGTDVAGYSAMFSKALDVLDGPASPRSSRFDRRIRDDRLVMRYGGERLETALTKTSKEDWINYLTGRTLGEYVLSSPLGGSEYGLVFKAQHLVDNSTAAIKLLAPGANAAATTDFENEGRLLERMDRASNVVDLLELESRPGHRRRKAAGAESGLALNTEGMYFPLRYHVLELADHSLNKRMVDEADRRKVSWFDRLWLWRDVIKGVHQLHIKGLVHRDIKGSNVLVFPRSAGHLTCKISDLGKAKDVNERGRYSAVDNAQGRADPSFAPPECLYLQAGDDEFSLRAADIYSVGSLLVELATGLGATFLAVGRGQKIHEQSLSNFKFGRRRDLSGLGQQYLKMSAIFAIETPPEIRHRAVELVDQLCNPIPQRRFPISVPSRRSNLAPELDWLIRQADIMIASLSGSPPPRQRSYRAGRRVR